jgi:hypothetical protein
MKAAIYGRLRRDRRPASLEQEPHAIARARRPGNCVVCLVEHNDEIHEATLSVRAWLKEQIAMRLEHLRD